MEFSEVIEKPRVDGLILRQGGLPPKDPCPGSLAITSHHLIFQSKKEGYGETMVKVQPFSTFKTF